MTDPVEGSPEWRIANLEAQVASLLVNFAQVQRDHMRLNHILDTLNTSLWKRLLFRVDGWPAWWDEGKNGPRWRPWHRWWVS